MKALIFSPFLLFLCLPSCDSPEMVKKRDQQALEISRLQGELAILEEQLKDVPVDRSGELERLEAEAQAQKEELTTLESEVSSLEAKKESLEKAFEEYKAKYVIR